MRSVVSLRAIASSSRTALPARAIAALPIASLPATPARALSTTSVLLKKSKAAAVKKSLEAGRKAQEVEDDEQPKGRGRNVAPIVDAEDRVSEVLAKTERKMEKAVGWARGIVYEMVERVRGKVSPSLLDGIKVTTKDVPGAQPLNQVASVTVSNHALVVEVWDESHAKVVLSAIQEANLPGVSPFKHNETTIKIPVARPLHEQRQEMLKQMGQTINSAKDSVRAGRTEGMSSLGGRRADGANDVQKLADEYGGQLDTLLSQAKKEFEKA